MLTDFLNSILLFLDATGYRLIACCVSAVLGYLVIRNLLKISKQLLVRSAIDNSLVHFILTIERIILGVLLMLYCLALLGVSLTGFIAALSALTLAIGLAIQDIIGGVANGLMLVSTKPFKVNDFVQIGDISGIIKEITLMHTVLCTTDNKRVMLPNKTVFSSEIINYSYNTSRRVEFIFSVDYENEIDYVKKSILEIVSAHPMVYSDPAPMCRLKEQSDNYLDFVTRVWCNTADYWTVYFDLMEEVYNGFDKYKININYPQLTISYRTDEMADAWKVKHE